MQSNKLHRSKMGEYVKYPIPTTSKKITDWQIKCQSLKERLNYAVTHEECADTVFLVGPDKEIVRCNKFMLCINSTVFEAMFSGRWESDETEITIPDVEPSAFRSFLKYLYTDEVRIKVQDAIPVIYIAKKYDVPKLVEKCVAVLKTKLNTANTVTIYQEAKSVYEDALVQFTKDFICKNAKRVFSPQVEDYLAFTPENLNYFLGLDELKIDELSLVKAVHAWGEEERRRRGLEETPGSLQLVLKDVMGSLRLPLLTAEEFAFEVVDKGMLNDQDSIMMLKYYSLSGSSRKSSQLPTFDFNAKPRTPLFSNLKYLMERYGTMKSQAHSYDSNGAKKLYFQVNRSISVVSFGFYGPHYAKTKFPVHYEVEIKIQDYDSRTVFGIMKQIVHLKNPTKVFHVEFECPVKIFADVWHALTFSLKGPNTMMGDDRKSEVRVSRGLSNDEVIFKFKDAKDSNTGGQFPEMYFIIF